MTTIVVTGILAPFAVAQAPRSLPAYEVRSTGASRIEAARLASALGLAKSPSRTNGVLSFIDDARFGFLPVRPVTAPGANLPDEEGRPVVAQAPDLNAIRKLRPLSASAARRRVIGALRRAGLRYSGTGRVTNSQFESFDVNGQQNAKAAVDTHVSFPVRVNRLRLIGPGSKAKFVFDPSGKVTYLRYARRELSRGSALPVIPTATADGLAARRFQEGCPGSSPVTALRLERRLVYYSPPLSLTSVKRIFPHYDYGGTARIGGQTVQLQRVLVPAVRRGTPQARLTASAAGGRVSARVTVRGGTAPYTYRYSSCATALPDRTARGGSRISYTVEPRPGATRPTSEKVSVVVTDANGLTATATTDAAIEVGPRVAPRSPSIGARSAIGGRADVGNEWIGVSQGLSNSASNNADFRDEMSDVATIAFSWGDDNVFESDFVHPTDTDWADNADLTYFQGHGNSDGFVTGKKQGDQFVSRTEVQWGNNDLEWMVVNSCSVLEIGSGATHVQNRWRPAFRGLHLMLGHGNLSYNVDGDGNEFGDNLADDDMRIRDAWIDANESYQPDNVIYRYMGVYGPNGEWNRDDHFHGIGSVSKDITTVTGAWSYSGSV